MSATVHTEHAAILFADVKGYSVLISRDEVGTYARLQRARALFRALVGDYGGRIVDEAGDGVLAAFADAGKAVDFALAIQRDLANAAAWHGENGPFAFRIGIHSGPVHKDGSRLYGKTLIVAQRIQEQTPASGVCISENVRRSIASDERYRCLSLGLRLLKNVEPIVIHQIFLAGAAELSDLSRDSRIAVTEYVDDASVAVLPFENHCPDPMNIVLCAAITIDVIDRLSRFRDLFVIARHSTFQYKSLLQSPSEIAQLLGARYITVGSVRNYNKKIEVITQLIQAESGVIIWSDRLKGTISDLFDIQEEIADMIAARLAHHIGAAERRRLIRSQTPQMSAYGLVVRANDLMIHCREHTNSHARHLLKEAATIDSSYSRIYSLLSRTYSEIWRCRWNLFDQNCLEEAVRLAQLAIDQDGSDALGFAELGYARLYRKQIHEALDAYERATTLNPNNADVIAEMSDVLTCLGQASRAIGLLQRAFRLNPAYPDWYLRYYAEALFDLEEYEQVVRSLGQMRDHTDGLKLLAASNALLGRIADAKRCADTFRAMNPGFSLNDWSTVPPNLDTKSQENYFRGLRLAGFE